MWVLVGLMCRLCQARLWPPVRQLCSDVLGLTEREKESEFVGQHGVCLFFFTESQCFSHTFLVTLSAKNSPEATESGLHGSVT